MKNHFILFIFYAFLKILIYLNSCLRFLPEVTFLDVGQGDSVLITTPERKRILIDGGPGYTVSQRLNSYFPLNNCKIDAIFLTHPHADHLEGLNRVLYNCSVSRIFYTPVLYESGMYDDFVNKTNALGKEGVLSSVFIQEDIYRPDYSDKLGLYGLWPTEEAINKEHPNVNNISTVIFLKYGRFEAFLTGDAELEVLNKVRSDIKTGKYAFLEYPVEIYKLSHHGAKNGFDSNLWADLNPLFTVISVGKENKFGHPHNDIISCLEKRDAKLLRTDIEGNIKIMYNSF